jgi:hypothetical protein
MRRAMVFGFLATCLALACTAGCARKTAAVECTVTYGGEARRLQFPATTEPYQVRPQDVAGRFRFKAIYLREPWTAASVNLYAYQQADAGDLLLQEAKYLPPFVSGKGARYGFTGRQLVYSAQQRELEYWCELLP